MARKQTQSAKVEDVDEVPEGTDAPGREEASVVTLEGGGGDGNGEAKADGTVGVMVEVAIPLKSSDGYASTTIERIPRPAARVLRDAADAARTEGARLQNGKVVSDVRDFLVWFAEKLEDGRKQV